MGMTGTQKNVVTLGIAGLAAVGVVYWLGDKAKAAAEAINPLNENNVFNQGATAIVQALPGADQQGTVGTDVYSAMHVWVVKSPQVSKPWAAGQVIGQAEEVLYPEYLAEKLNPFSDWVQTTPTGAVMTDAQAAAAGGG